MSSESPPGSMMNPADADAREPWSYESLRAESEEIRTRLNRFRTYLGRFFVDKQPLIDLMLVAAMAREPLLLVGPSGSAKSELVRKFHDALGAKDDAFFEYTLTGGTAPGEILGDASQSTRPGLYAAQVVLLNDVFQANSAVLNSLLTVIHGGSAEQDGDSTPSALRALFATTRDVPESADSSGLRDRFAIKAECGSVQNANFDELIAAGLRNETDRALRRKPWAEGHANFDDVLKAHRLLMHELAGCDASGGQADRERFFPEAVFRNFQRLIKTLARDDRVLVSDRRLIKLYKLFRARAWLFSGGVVGHDDLVLLAYVGDNLEEIQLLRDKVPLLLGRV